MAYCFTQKSTIDARKMSTKSSVIEIIKWRVLNGLGNMFAKSGSTDLNIVIGVKM